MPLEAAIAKAEEAAVSEREELERRARLTLDNLAKDAAERFAGYEDERRKFRNVVIIAALVSALLVIAIGFILAEVRFSQ